jgi:glycosyltransferase involved in cell wall biosynthesis
MDHQTKTAFFSICAKNYLPIVRTCLHSLLDTQPDARVVLVLCDEIDDGYDPSTERFEVIQIGEVPIPDFADMALRYDVMELCTAVKPFSFDHLFSQGHKRVIYCDPDLLFLKPLEHVSAAFDAGAEAVVTPHICEPIQDSFLPNDQSMLQVGVFNLGFLALQKGKDTLRFVRWWADKLRTGAVADLPNGLFTDQKWCDLLPCFVENTTILRHPGYNLAYWNLMHREVRKSKSEWTAAGQFLYFVHFSGPSFDDPSVFSKHQNRYKVDDIGDLSELFSNYCKAVKSNKWEESRHYKYSYNYDHLGQPIPAILRSIYRDVSVSNNAATSSSKSYKEASKEKLVGAIAYANAASPHVASHDGCRISNLMYRVWQARPDLQAAFTLTTQDSRFDFVGWYLGHGWTEIGIDERFLTPIRKSIGQSPSPTPENSSPAKVTLGTETVGVDAESSENGHAVGTFVSGQADSEDFPVAGLKEKLGRAAFAMRPVLRPIYWALPPELKARGRRWIQRSTQQIQPMPNSDQVALPSGLPVRGPIRLADIAIGDSTNELAQESSATNTSISYTKHPEMGVTLLGYSQAELGMGEHVRMSAAALNEKHVPFGIYNVSLNVVARQNDRRFDGLFLDTNKYRANILHINADQIPLVRAELGEAFFEDRYNIAFPAWELAIWPDPWVETLNKMDEVWAPSDFVRDAIAAKVDVPVHTMTLAVELAEGYGRWRRSDFGIPDKAYVFLFNFDLASMSARKNPKAVIEAFRMAVENLPATATRPHLVIKVLSADLAFEALQDLRVLVSDDNRIQIITGTYTSDKVHGLLNVCDCFVSLHRSEGFGRGPAEAMRMGKPVIATNYGGNTDFMNAQNSLLVQYALVDLHPDDYPFAAGQKWADPNLHEAAEYIAKLLIRPAFGAAIGAAAKKHMEAHNSKSVVGASIVRRLREINAV